MTDRDAATVGPAKSSRADLACGLAYASAWGVFATGEWFRPDRAGGLQDWLLAVDLETFVWLILLLVAPFAWRLRNDSARPRRTRTGGAFAVWTSFLARAADSTPGPIARAIGLSLVVAAVSLGTSVRLAAYFDHLPPAYHDEYSYLFQAETFLAGRVSFPSHDLAPLFDQMHVLNAGQFASRYFPGTGLWMAPFVALGNPWLGHWVAGALTAWLTFWCGRELAGDFAGLLAGLLTALAPGMALFSNLLLAHHPTLVGLSLFLLGYLRCMRRQSTGWAVAAGAGLCFAAACRPMTAAGMALPFGVHLLYRTAQSVCAKTPPAPMASSIRTLLAIGFPLLVGGALMFFYDRAITGSGWVTPYGLYTERHTPRHRYGFNNVVLGEQHLGPHVIEKYDTWAENLTPRLAAQNVCMRFVASWRWTLGLLPLTMALVAGLVWWKVLGVGTRLTLAGIVSLHAAHVPYWFVGMQDYHYVFESGPLWLLWTAATTVQAFRAWRDQRRWWLPAWWMGVLAAAVVMNYGVRSGRWSAPLDKGLAEVRFSREKHGRFLALIAREVHPRPAIVLIEDDPADRHIDYVANDPSLTGDVLIGKYIPQTVSVEEVRRSFPDRTLFLYRARTGSFERLATRD